MNQKVSKSLIAGILGTLLMTLVMILLPSLGFPELNPTKMLGTMFGISAMFSWVVHFLIGIVFALFYTLACLMKKFVSNDHLRGVLFGIIVFVLAQVGLVVLGKLVEVPQPQGDMTLMVIGSVIAHIVYGYTVVRVVGDTYK